MIYASKSTCLQYVGQTEDDRNSHYNTYVASQWPPFCITHVKRQRVWKGTVKLHPWPYHHSYTGQNVGGRGGS